MSFDMKRICNIVFLTKIEHSPTVKSEYVYKMFCSYHCGKIT